MLQKVLTVKHRKKGQNGFAIPMIIEYICMNHNSKPLIRKPCLASHRAKSIEMCS